MKIAIYPGAFKPPHKGHFQVVKLLVDRDDISEVVVAVSSKERGGISVEQSLKVWELYTNILGPKVKVISSEGSPVYYTLSSIKNNPDQDFVVAFGKEESSRFASLADNPKVEVFDAGNFENTSATDFRDAIQARNVKQIEKFMPAGITTKQFFDAYGSVYNNNEEPMHESLKGYKLKTGDTITVELINKQEYPDYVSLNIAAFDKDNNKIGGAYFNSDETNNNKIVSSTDTYVKPEWQRKGVGTSMYDFVKKLGYKIIPSNTQSPEGEKFTSSLHENQFPLLKEFIGYCREYLKLKSLPPLTMSYNPTTAESRRSFGGYDPNNKSIELSVANRHQADVFRTLAHELVHYKQDIQNRLTPESGKTGHPHENEANAAAAIMMRNFAQMRPEMFIIK